MPEQRIPGSEKLEQLLTSLHAQLYVLHSQMATWQSSSASYTDVQLLLGWEIGASAW